MKPAGLEIATIAKAEGAVCVRLSGVLDEQFDASMLSASLAPITVFDLAEVKRITSFGLRQWSEAMKALPSAVKHLYLVRCPPSFTDQLNLVLNLGGRSEILSAIAVYFCEHCQQERRVQLDVLLEREQIASGQLSAVTCPECQAPLRLQDDPQQYLRFAQTYGALSMDPQAALLLERTGLYHVRDPERPLEELKLVHGDVTLLTIAGTLDTRFRPRRMASGLEGHVVFDLSDVEGVDEEGAARWQTLLEELRPVESITIAELSEKLLTTVAERRFSIAGTRVYSVRVSWRCSCGAESVGRLRPAELPNLGPHACGRCGRPMALATERRLLERVFAVAAEAPGAIPAASEQVIMQRDELVSRARAESAAQDTERKDGLSRYRVIRPLTQGGMAEILLAVHTGIGGFEKLIALKKIRREMLERRHVAIELFLNEAKIAANLSHANIVQIFEVGEHDGDLFIAMEYVHGKDTRALIRRAQAANRKPPLPLVLFIGSQVAAALHHAHQACDLSGRQLNIVHRDVSLSNIMIGFEGQVKLIDFGIAAASVVDPANGALIGKISYMSPEQIRGEPFDGRSDVFSLGIVLYELIAQRPLFRRSSDDRTRRAVMEDPIPSLTSFGVPAFVEAALRRALARDRDERYPDARAFELELTTCRGKIGTPVSSHDLAVLMRELFGDDSAMAPFDGAPSATVNHEQDGGAAEAAVSNAPLAVAATEKEKPPAPVVAPPPVMAVPTSVLWSILIILAIGAVAGIIAFLYAKNH